MTKCEGCSDLDSKAKGNFLPRDAHMAMGAIMKGDLFGTVGIENPTMSLCGTPVAENFA